MSTMVSYDQYKNGGWGVLLTPPKGSGKQTVCTGMELLMGNLDLEVSSWI